MFSYQYAYLVSATLLLFPIWLLLFLHRKDLRQELLLVSIVIGIIGPISELWYLQDYWRPETFNGWTIGVEDFLFGFFIGGIGSVIYEELFGKHFTKRLDRTHHWRWFLIPIVILFLLGLNIPFLYFDINSIYASIIALLVTAAVMMYFRTDLWGDLFMSGVLVGLIMSVNYLIFLKIFPEAIHRWWELENISGILVMGIPLEELLWAFSWGMVGGPIYEFFTGRKFSRRIARNKFQ